MAREIPLTRGQVAVVDDEDFERLSAFKWNAVRGRKGAFYASRSVRPSEGLGVQTRQMQRDILDPRGEVPRTQLADHIDRNPLNNRRSNLRWADYSLSNKNRSLPEGTGGGFRGVHFCQTTQRFVATLRTEDRVHHRKCLTAEEAARAYDALVLRFVGADARLNFPDEVREELAARAEAAALCERLRARGDNDSVAAACMIEGTLEAFSGLVRDLRGLRLRADAAERNQRATLDLWARVPSPVRAAVARTGEATS